MPDKVRPPGFTQDVATDTRTIGGQEVEIQRVDELGGSTFTPNQVSIATTATLIAAARDTRKRILVRNDGLGIVVLGGSGVTLTTGIRLWPGEEKPLRTTAAVYGIAVVGALASVSYWEEHDS